MATTWKMPYGLKKAGLCVYRDHLWQIESETGDEVVELRKISWPFDEFVKLTKPTETDIAALTSDGRVDFILLMLSDLLKRKK